MISDSYKIHHFDLAADNPKIDLANGKALYCVFWYKSVPIGERYLAANVAGNPNEFWRECANAIWPALEHYALQQGLRFVDQKPATPTQESIKLNCEVILEKVHVPVVTDQVDVSVVICTRNRAAFLKTCLKNLQKQKSKPREIIVVDNASIGDETRMVCSLFDNVKYVREDRLGLDRARNRGAIEATSSIVAYTDDDTLPDKYWTYRLSESFKDPSIAAMTGLVMAASLNTEAEVIFEKFWPFNRGYIPKKYDYNFISAHLETGPPVWEIGAGANMAFRKTTFEQVGYFDERLDVGAAGCSGDSELWYRILTNGSAILYDPLAVVQHTHRDSMNGLKKQLYSYMRGFTVAILIQYQRYGHRGNLLHLLKVLPPYYLSLLRKGFPNYSFQYQTLFAEMKGIVSGVFYYWKHRNTDPKIYW
jgi:glycosyltransferase involved in cell wall biosynthesis